MHAEHMKILIESVRHQISINIQRAIGSVSKIRLELESSRSDASTRCSWDSRGISL